MNDSTDKHTPETVEAFIDRWQDTGGKKCATYHRAAALPGSEPAKNSFAILRYLHLEGSTTRGIGANSARC